MTSLEQLEQRIQEKLGVSSERLQLRHDHTQELMRAADRAESAYTAAADRLMETVIRPRLAAVKAQLEPIATSDADGSRHTCILRFSHTPRFPARVCLEIGITRDGDARTLIVQYRLQILPVFFAFDGSEDLSFTIDQVDPERVASWLNDKLVAFVETYLRLEVEQLYQDENRAIDPVCGMTVSMVDAPARAEYGGKPYFFCVEKCRDRFLADPARYIPRPCASQS